jgi:hypothetical protein
VMMNEARKQRHKDLKGHEDESGCGCESRKTPAPFERPTGSAVVLRHDMCEEDQSTYGVTNRILKVRNGLRCDQRQVTGGRF